MPRPMLLTATAAVPARPWAVGVSGGADSVAALAVLRERADLPLVVVHLDHETRGRASTDDAAFVADLAAGWSLPVVLAKRSEIEPHLAETPANPSALYRACRLELFRRVVRGRQLGGVILAHHADDQAETVLHRLVRGAPPRGLTGMAPRSIVGGLMILRPFLAVRRRDLRQVLAEQSLPHREDASNASDDYVRNRLRRVLADREDLTRALLDLAGGCGAMKQWIAGAAPSLGESFAVGRLADLPAPLAREAARRWLIARGCVADELGRGVLERLIRLCADAATPAVVQFPGGVTIRRRRGMVAADRADIIGPDEH